MDRDTAVRLAQDAIRANNHRLIEALLARRAERERAAGSGGPGTPAELPLIAVTCATGWECYAIVEELVQTGASGCGRCIARPAPRRRRGSRRCCADEAEAARAADAAAGRGHELGGGA